MMPRSIPSLLFSLLLLCAAARAAAAQTPDANCERASGPAQQSSTRKLTEARATHYIESRLPASEVGDLRRALRECRFNDALTVYFKGAYNPELVDWVVYIPKDGAARHALIRGADQSATFRAQRYVWTVVFADRPLATTDTAKDKSALVVSRRSINYERDPFLGVLLSTALSKFLASPAADPAQVDSTRELSLTPLSAEPSDTMYVGHARFGLVDNTQVVMSLYPAAGHEYPGTLTSVYTTIVNSRQSLWEFGLSIGTGYSPHPGPVDSTTTAAKMKPELLLQVYLNLVRPQLPVRRHSAGLVFGSGATNLMEDFLVGLSLGRLFPGGVGLVAGNLWKRETHGVGAAKHQGRFARLYVGTDLRF